MPRKRYSPEEIITMLREADVRLSQGETVGEICRALAVSEQRDYRWRREYGGLKAAQARRLKDLERVNQRLRKAVAHVTATATAMKQQGCSRPILLATRYTMEQPFYRGRPADTHGIQAIAPDEAGKALVHGIVYNELCRGIVEPGSKAAYLDQIAKLSTQGTDSITLGCTEVGMLIGQQDVILPVFDTTNIHATAAVDFALAKA